MALVIILAQVEILEKNIEHAVYQEPNIFSIIDCIDKDSPTPLAKPKASFFEEYVRSFNITNGHHIIVYDNDEEFGFKSSPRVWWLFHLFGHDKVSVLDGGLPKWKKDGCPTTSGDYGEDEIYKGILSCYILNSFSIVNRESMRRLHCENLTMKFPYAF